MIRQGNEPANSRAGLSGGRKSCKMGKSGNTKRAQDLKNHNFYVRIILFLY